MKIKDLIAHLNTLDPEASVTLRTEIYSCDYNHVHDRVGKPEFRESEDHSLQTQNLEFSSEKGLIIKKPFEIHQSWIEEEVFPYLKVY